MAGGTCERVDVEERLKQGRPPAGRLGRGPRSCGDERRRPVGSGRRRRLARAPRTWRNASVKRIVSWAEWAVDFRDEGMATWHYGYVSMLLAEYVGVTGDESVVPGLTRLVLEAAHGQSAVGSWGHRFARPDGRLYGYGMMNSPGLPLTISLVMARGAGVKDPALDQAIDSSATLLRLYIGKGAIPFGDHHPSIENHGDNGKCRMAAVVFNLLGESKGAEFFTRMSVASHGPKRDTGHTGNFFNVLWGLPGVSQAGPHATGAWMREFGSWYSDLARQWDTSCLHQGPPEPEADSYAGWDSTGGDLLAYAMPLKKLHLTGKKTSTVPQLDAAAAQSLILDGRGWNNKDRTSLSDALTDDQLLDRLRSWSPVVRERAVEASERPCPTKTFGGESRLPKPSRPSANRPSRPGRRTKTVVPAAASHRSTAASHSQRSSPCYPPSTRRWYSRARTGRCSPTRFGWKGCASWRSTTLKMA